MRLTGRGRVDDAEHLQPEQLGGQRRPHAGRTGEHRERLGLLPGRELRQPDPAASTRRQAATCTTSRA